MVHLAADPSPEAGWDALLPANIEAPYQVATAAVACGVRRLVLASSLHASRVTPDGRQHRATDQPRPLNLYGATKAWAEALGADHRRHLVDDRGRAAHRLVRRDPPAGDEEWRGQHGAWLSSRDAADLVRAAVEATNVDGSVVVNGTSANRYQVADLTEALALGYQPQDDAWTRRGPSVPAQVP